MQADGFASDSTRMISSIRRQNPALQLLLFSATFNDDVKRFAQKVVGAEANQVCFRALQMMEWDMGTGWRMCMLF